MYLRCMLVQLSGRVYDFSSSRLPLSVSTWTSIMLAAQLMHGVKAGDQTSRI